MNKLQDKYANKYGLKTKKEIRKEDNAAKTETTVVIDPKIKYGDIAYVEVEYDGKIKKDVYCNCEHDFFMRAYKGVRNLKVTLIRIVGKANDR